MGQSLQQRNLIKRVNQTSSHSPSPSENIYWPQYFSLYATAASAGEREESSITKY